MRDQQNQPNNAIPVAQHITEDLEPTDERTAEITGGDRPAGSASPANITIMKPIDLSSPNLFA